MHTLPPLPYNYDALEPYYDAATVKLHHDLHHKAYVDGFNAAYNKMKSAQEARDYSSIKAISKDLAFHGSGHFSTLFFGRIWPLTGRLEKRL
jgi:superoxide dismutase, Fe-Mn family